MANIDPAPSWANIRRLETTDRNMAGPGGILNDPTTSIAARLNLLRDNDNTLGNSIADVNSRQDAADTAIANIQGQVLNAPGTLSDLENGPALDPAAGFPDVPSVENTLGPIDAINETIDALTARTKQLRNGLDPLLTDGAASLGYTAIAGRTVAMRLGERISLLDVVDDSGAQENHTQMMIRALSQSNTVYVPAGSYTLQPGLVSLTSNKTVFFSPDAVVNLQASSGQAGTNSAFFIGGSANDVVKNVRVSGGQWVSDNDRTVVVGVRSYVDGVYIEDLVCTNIRALHTNDTAAGNYTNSTSATRPKNVRVSGCQGMCTNQVTNNSFAQFNYCDGGGCEFNVIDGYWFGESWWGGDSNHNVNGAEGNERKATCLSFVGSIMGRRVPMRQAGIWGSMGEGILVDSAVVIGNPDISDVGIDFEGCVASSAVNCYAKNFRNGNFATFYLCNGVTFSGCTSVISASNITISARINNASQLTANRGISFVDCTFINTASTSRVIDAGAHTGTRYANNKHLNVGTRFHSNNNGAALLSGNYYHFTIAPTDATFAAIHVGRFTQGGVIIRDNVFSSAVTWTVGVGALSMESVDTNPMNVQVYGGGTLGNQFPQDIVATHSGTSGTNTLTYTVEGYNLFAGRYVVNNTGALAPVGFLVDCRSGAARTPWPSAVPTTGYWSRGQRVDLSRTASSGGFTASICVAAGIPGTWASTGAIA